MSWAAIWTFIKKIPGWVWLVFAAAILGKLYLEGEKAKVRKDVNDERDREAAEAITEVVSNITENTDAVIHDADAVRAGDAIVELSDGTKTLPDYHFRD